MEKDRHTYLGQFTEDGSEQSKSNQKISGKSYRMRMVRKLSSCQRAWRTGAIRIDVDADASTAKRSPE